MDLRTARRVFSRVGFSLFALLASTTVAQLLLVPILPEDMPYYTWISTFLPIYVISFPLAFLLLRPIPAAKVEQNSFSVGKFIRAAFICLGLMFAGSLLGTFVTTALSAITGSEPLNPVLSFVADESLFIKILVVVLIAPVLEEILFRKMIMDRLLPYGEKTALITTALAFGLFHGNLSQFFYTAALSFVLGYVYLRTGKLRWPCVLHMFVNFLGSIVSPIVFTLGDPAILSNPNLSNEELMLLMEGSDIILLFTYVLLYGIAAAVGIVLFFLSLKKVYFRPAQLQLPAGKRFSTIWCSAGMIVFFLACAVSIVLTFITV